MVRATVEVPAEVVDPIRETVLLLYGATADSLRLALRARGEGHGSIEEVDLHRLRLAGLDALLRELGLAPGPVRLEGDRDLLHDTLYGALIDSGERLAEISNRCWRGELPLERVQEAAEEVLSIERLLRRVRGE